jgi:FkbM family methyltransferase
MMPARGTHISTLLLLQERGFVPKTVLDIGAAEGAFYLFLRENDLYSGARHFFVDAMQENEAGYRKLAAKVGAGYEIAALSCMEGETVLRLDPGFYNTHIDDLQPATAYKASRRVPVTTLNRVVERRELEPPFVIKLDVQGGELDVLRGGVRALEDAIVVTCEIQIFAERDSVVELLAFMQGNGWTLYDLTDLAYFPSDATLYQCYATFIPRSMDFRKSSVWGKPDQETAALKVLHERRASVLKAIDRLVD